MICRKEKSKRESNPIGYGLSIALPRKGYCLTVKFLKYRKRITTEVKKWKKRNMEIEKIEFYIWEKIKSKTSMKKGET